MGKVKNCNSKKNGNILCNENKIVKYLMNAFWINIEFTKILNQFKQKK
jgi:hypothetical protein